MQDIHDIRPPVMVGMDPAAVKLALMVGAAVVGLILLFLGIRYFLKKKRQGAVPELIPAIPPFDRAMKDLDRMAVGPAGDPRAFYFQLGRTVKAYMGDVFKINCLEMTTPELIRTVKGSDLPREMKREIAEFQEVCDPFRYAPAAPSPERIQADLSRARALVQNMEDALFKPPVQEGQDA